MKENLCETQRLMELIISITGYENKARLSQINRRYKHYYVRTR